MKQQIIFIVRRQIALADFIIMNKVDLIPEVDLLALEKKIR